MAEIDQLRARIVTLEREITEIRGDLSRRTMRQPVGSKGLEIQTHTDFPVIPNKPELISCKGSIWGAIPGDTYWYPVTRYVSEENGEPGT